MGDHEDSGPTGAVTVRSAWPEPSAPPISALLAPPAPGHPVGAAPRSVAAAGRRVLPGALAAVTAAAVAVAFAPWLRTGSAHRTSFQVVVAADHLDVLSPGPQAAMSVVWAFVPLVGVLAVLALTLGRTRSAAVLALAVGLVVAGFGLVIMNAPRSADWGATAGTAIGLTLVVVALITAWSTRSTT